MKRLAVLSFALVVTTAALAAPQAPGGGPGGPPDGRGSMHGGMGGPGMGGRGMGGPGMGGPMDRSLFPPDVILSNQIALGVTDDQVSAIKKLLGETHNRVIDVQTDLRRVTEQLHDAVAPAKVDEKAALTLASQAMDLEKQVKTAHLTLMIRVKNLLTPDQQEKARALMPQRKNGPPDGDRD
jgi:Spy/CpxP family protein refolding chaperone